MRTIDRLFFKAKFCSSLLATAILVGIAFLFGFPLLGMTLTVLSEWLQ